MLILDAEQWQLHAKAIRSSAIRARRFGNEKLAQHLHRLSDQLERAADELKRSTDCSPQVAESGVR